MSYSPPNIDFFFPEKFQLLDIFKYERDLKESEQSKAELDERISG